MKTILKTYHKQSDVVAYHKYELRGVLCEENYDENGKPLNFQNSDGYSYECTRDERGHLLTYENSDGFSYKYTLDKNGYQIAYKDSDGYYKVKGKKVSKEEYEDFISQLNSVNLEDIKVEITKNENPSH